MIDQPVSSGFVVSEVLESFGLHVEIGDGIFVVPGRKLLVEMMFYLSSINMMLGIFNLLPGLAGFVNDRETI